MIKRTILCTASALVLVAGAMGCAAKPKTQLTILEQRNRNLTNQLNRCYGDLELSMQERDSFNGRLASALREADDLRGQLAAQPEPELAAAPAGWTAVPGGGMISIEDNVLFAPGKAVLRGEARRALDAIVSTVGGEYASKDILVFGHTDNRPIKKSGWADNWQLSTERSLAVVRYLRDHGVSVGRLAACGCGEHRPRVPNSSEPNRTANRRVEIFAIDAQPRTGRPN